MVTELDLGANCTRVHNSLEAILHSTVEAVGARCGSIAVVSGEDHSLHQGPCWGPLPSLKSRMTAARWVMTQGEPLVLENREQCSQVPGLVIRKEALLPLICMPVQSRGKALGALQVNVPSSASDRELSQKVQILKLAATLVSCLLENDTLQQQLQEKEANAMRLVRSTIEAQEGERERICLEVHDGVSQTLAAVFQHLQALESTLPPQESQTRHIVSRTVALVKQAIQEAREVINSLTPATLSDLGLVSTLRQELKQFEKDTACKVEFESDWPRLPQDTETALYRIVHEAVTNVRKHANSQKMRVQLSRLPDRLVALIRDWGVGFDPSQQESIPTRNSTGLFSMHKRAELLGGACEVHSAPGQGTEIKVEVPIN